MSPGGEGGGGGGRVRVPPVQLPKNNWLMREELKVALVVTDL